MRSPTWRGTSSICPGRGWIKSACKVSIGERFPFHAGDLKHSLAGAMSRSSVAETWAAPETRMLLLLQKYSRWHGERTAQSVEENERTVNVRGILPVFFPTK